MIKKWMGDKMHTENQIRTNKTRTLRSTIIIGMFLLHAIAATGWAGELVGWGLDTYGQVSNAPSGTDFVGAAAGGNHSLALRTDGRIVAWGYDGSGQVSNTPTGNNFVAITAGVNHSLALKSDGSLVAWGSDSSGQVSDTPSGYGFVAISSGEQHSVALKSDGSLAAWGYDAYDQVSNTPAGDNFVTVSAGYHYNVALKSDGSIVSWGDNGFGQVSNTPAGNNFTAVAAGGYHSVALKSDGSLVSWGLDTVGQVSDTPTGNNFTAIVAGRGHSVAYKSDGSLAAWGWDNCGQVSDTPSGSDFTDVATRTYHNVAVRDSVIPTIPAVSIAATDASAGEPSNDGYFTVSRTGATTTSLRVYYSTSGSTASAGTDYAALPGYVNIPAGQSSATILVDVIDDSTVESSETVRLTISSNAAYTIGSPSYATVTIADDDNDVPEDNIVTITAPDASAAEPANDGSFTVSRTGATSTSLRVYFSTSGSTATARKDYAALPRYVDIPSGQTSASIPVYVIDDTAVESSETVRVTISSDSAYTIGSPSSATVTIADDDDEPPVDETIVTITAPDASAAEPANNGSFTVNRTGATSVSLRVYYSTIGSTASSGADYTALPGYVDIPAGQSSAVIYVDVTDDTAVESSETVRLTISSNAAYTIGSPSYATVTIADDDDVPPPPPDDVVQMMADTLTFFYASVDDGSLVGISRGLYSMQYMLEAAYNKIVAGDSAGACGQLTDALSRCDGNTVIPDYVAGSATATLNAMIEEVINVLGCT